MNVSSFVSESYSGCAQGNVKAKVSADIAEHGKKSRPDLRDTFECSIQTNGSMPAETVIRGKFNNFYSDYEGYGNPVEFGNFLRYRYSHTIGHNSTWFFEAVGRALQEAKGEKEGYDGCDVVNAYGFAYGTLYEEIEKRHENSKEQWFDIDGTPLTKDKEMEYLNAAYESAVAFKVSSAEVMAGLKYLNGQIPEVSRKGIEELGKTFYRSRDKYMELYKASKMAGEPMSLQRISFGNSALLALLV